MTPHQKHRHAQLTAIVLTRLNVLTRVGPELEAMVSALGGLQTHPVSSELARDREMLIPRFVVSGWAARVRWLGDGRRQIISFVIPGDSIGICERPQPLALAPVVALTSVQTLDAGPLQDRLLGPDPPAGLAEAIHLAASHDEAVLIDQVVRLGRQTAYERIAHLLLELRHRHQVVGLGDETEFPCPLTQEMLADATGLSIVHVNRTLQQLRGEGMLEMRAGRVRLLEPDLLRNLSDWHAAEPSAWRR